MLYDLAQSYTDVIGAVVGALGVSHATAHVHVGLGLYLLGQFIFRDRRGSVRALQFVLACELANEAADLIAYGEMRWADTMADILLTLFWPTAIYAMSIVRRRRFDARITAFDAIARTNPLHELVSHRANAPYTPQVELRTGHAV